MQIDCEFTRSKFRKCSFALSRYHLDYWHGLFRRRSAAERARHAAGPAAPCSLSRGLLRASGLPNGGRTRTRRSPIVRSPCRGPCHRGSTADSCATVRADGVRRMARALSVTLLTDWPSWCVPEGRRPALDCFAPTALPPPPDVAGRFQHRGRHSHLLDSLLAHGVLCRHDV